MSNPAMLIVSKVLTGIPEPGKERVEIVGGPDSLDIKHPRLGVPCLLLGLLKV